MIGVIMGFNPYCFTDNPTAENLASDVYQELEELEIRFDERLNELKTLFIAELEKQKDEIKSLKLENYQLIKENEALKEEIQNLKSERNKNYDTMEIKALHDVLDEFWANHTPDKVPPKKETVTKWIKENYDISDNMAKAIDTIARPEIYRTGGNKAL